MSDERKCGELATTEIFWPGRAALLCCERHARKAIAIASAMGLFVSVRAYDGKASCEQVVNES